MLWQWMPGDKVRSSKIVPMFYFRANFKWKAVQKKTQENICDKMWLEAVLIKILKVGTKKSWKETKERKDPNLM